MAGGRVGTRSIPRVNLKRRLRALARDLREVAEPPERVADVEQQPQAIRADAPDPRPSRAPRRRSARAAAPASRPTRAPRDVAVDARDLRPDRRPARAPHPPEQRAVQLGRRVVGLASRQPVRAVVRRVDALEAPACRARRTASPPAGPRLPRSRTAAARAARTNSTGTSSRPSSRSSTKSRTSSAQQLARGIDEAALDREPAEPDRRAPQAVRVARAGRPVAERERDGRACRACRRPRAPCPPPSAAAARRPRPAGTAPRSRRRPPPGSRRAARTRRRCGPRGPGTRARARTPGRPSRAARPRASPRRRRARRRAAQPLGLVGERARAREERDRAEPLGEPLDADRDVALEREARVLEPPLEHALVPGSHELGVAAVRDEREAVAAEREVALVRLHRGHDHALGQLEEALVERCPRARSRSRPGRRPPRARRRIAPAAERVEPRDDLRGAAPRRPARRLRRAAARRTRRACGDLDRAVREAVPEATSRRPTVSASSFAQEPAHGPREADAARRPSASTS